MTTTRASEMDNLRSVVRFRPDQSGLTGRTGRTVRTGPLDGPRPLPGRGRRRPHGGQMSTTTTPPTLPDLIAALQSLHAELSAIRADLDASNTKERHP